MKPIPYSILRVNGYAYIAPTPEAVVELVKWFYHAKKAA
jgi:hypothetical protein